MAKRKINFKILVTVAVEDLKCKVAELEYNKLLNEVYGVESCNFEGYNSVIGLKLKIDLIESGFDCNERS